jgi:hypothetical protein
VQFQPYGGVAPAGGETAVNTNTAESVSTADGNPGEAANALSADSSGDYVVAWQYPQGSGYAVSARVYNADGSPRTGELAVGTGAKGIGVPQVAMAGNGQFVVAWPSASGGIFLQLRRRPAGRLLRRQRVRGGRRRRPHVDRLESHRPQRGATVTQVAFYATDSSGNQYLLGYGTNNNGVWALAFTVSLPPGSYTLFAEATDSLGVLGADSALLELTVQ